MNEYKVPTVQLDVEVVCVDGSALTGVIFLPALSAVHAGPMAPEEWINGPLAFFPLRAAGARGGVLLNKQQVLALTASPAPPDGEQPESPAPDLPARRVVIEAGGRRFEGVLVIDMPLNQQRVLDYVNRPGAFLLLHRDDGRISLIQKAQIARVEEMEEP